MHQLNSILKKRNHLRDVVKSNLYINHLFKLKKGKA